MTITKCDRCGKEIPSMNDVVIVQAWPWSRPSREKRFELCEWCATCMTDWIKEDSE